ncbi:MAG: hypothetical protein C5B59_02505 [Bacteroidetes bacterium]|nr:MAG: hypothetical protein C5B59_02505 [Bacteroidota bacterium]
MQFIILAVINGKPTRLYVSFIRKNDRMEFYQVDGNNGGIALSCNRPILQANGMKDFPAHWNLEEGEINKIALKKISEATGEP